MLPNQKYVITRNSDCDCEYYQFQRNLCENKFNTGMYLLAER